ncbi:MAG: helix-turn-helix domain-containing protein [Clostridiales Family XIII bacterium]|nr:helix-turn-helix domain-containing protein [Clostridiales Family XIII bacterium]
MEIDYRQIGRRIAGRRGVLALTQAELAERADMSATYAGNVERGAKCSIETLMKLCAALEVTPDYLLLGVDKQYDADLLEELRDLVGRCDPKMKNLIASFVRWCADQKV